MVYEQTLSGGARELGAAVVWMGPGFNSPEGRVKALCFSSPRHKEELEGEKAV